MATPLSYGIIYPMGLFIFPNQSGGQTPQPIFMQNGLIDVD